MSDQFAKNNDEKSIELFYKKFNYSFTVDDKQGTLNNVKDFFNAEKLLYGRVDRNYVPIIVSRGVTPAAVFSSTADAPVSAHPFVAEAFRDLRTQAQKALTLGQLNTAGDVSFLASLLPVRGHQDHYKLYSQHINSIMIGAKSAWNKDNVKFSNFDEFIVSFLPAIEKLTATLPYTLPAFIKHRICPITVSGLAIEISADDSSKDADKVARFLNDPNWPYYVNLCRSYGFSIDKNVPWRLVADIATSEMLEYAKKYGYYNTDSILGNAFEPAHFSYFPQFISFIEKAYDYLRMENYIEVGVCRYSELKPKNYYT